MQPSRARDEAGNVWELDAQGNATRLVEPAAPAAPSVGRVFSLPPNPRDVARERRADDAAARAAAASDRAAGAADRQAGAAERSARRVDAEIPTIGLPTGTERGPDGAARGIPGAPFGPPDSGLRWNATGTGLEPIPNFQRPAAPVSAGDSDARTAREAALGALSNQLRAVRSRYSSDLEGQGLSSVIQALPTPGNRAFNSAGQGLINPFMAAFRVAGTGSQSDLEARQFVEANVPLHNDPDEVIEQKLLNIENRLSEFRQAANIPEDAPVAPPEQGADRSSVVAMSDDNGGARSAPSRGSRSVEDASLRGVAARLGQMVARGVPDNQVLSYLREAGVDPAETSINQILQYRRTPQFQTWRQQNPGRPYPVSPSFYTQEVPLGPVESVVNNVAQSPVGAYAIGAANGVSLNRLDDIADATGGNGEQVRAAQDIVRGENPLSSLAGDVSGMLLAESTLGRIPGVRAFMRTPGGRRVADAGYGAAMGSGMGEGTSLEGGALGTVLGLGGGMAGRSIQRGVGSAFTGIKNESLDYLRQRGVTPTIGQIARATSTTSLPARIVAGTEDRLTGLPGIGDAVNAARIRTGRQFENAAFDEGLAPIGGQNAGREGVAAVDNMQAATGQAYDNALAGVDIPADATFIADMAAARAMAGRVDPRALSTIDDAFERRMDTGTLSGENFQGARQVLREAAPAFRLEAGGNPAARSIDNAEQSLTELAGRQAPAVMPALTAADRAYRNQQILQAAVPNSPTQVMSPAQLTSAARNNTINYGGRNLAESSGRPFFDLTTAGGRVMPSSVPDSGTVGRGAIALPLGGAVVGGGQGGASAQEGGMQAGAMEGAGRGALIGAALGAPYSRAGQQALGNLLLGRTLRDATTNVAGRPVSINIVGEALRDSANSPFALGTLGAALARELGLYDELEPAQAPR